VQIDTRFGMQAATALERWKRDKRISAGSLAVRAEPKNAGSLLQLSDLLCRRRLCSQLDPPIPAEFASRLGFISVPHSRKPDQRPPFVMEYFFLLTAKIYIRLDSI
jgi:hypothetical protein